MYLNLKFMVGGMCGLLAGVCMIPAQLCASAAGDTDTDGTVTLSDAALLSLLLGESPETAVTGYGITLSDCNGDGLLTIADLRLQMAAANAAGWQWNEETGWRYPNAEGLLTIDGTAYLFDAAGSLLTEWQEMPDGTIRYFDRKTRAVPTGWLTLEDGSRSYIDAEQGRLSGEQTLGSRRYLFNAEGVMQTGFCEAGDGIVRYYEPADGHMMTGFLSVNGETYLFDSDGTMQTGLCTVLDSTYLFNENGVMQRGFITDENGDLRFFSESLGIMQTGWFTHGDKLYCTDEDGVLQVGFVTTAEGRRYFGTDGAVRTGLFAASGSIYCADSAGLLQKGFVTCPDGSLRFFSPTDYTMRIGMFAAAGGIYCTDEDGMILTGFVIGEDGCVRYFAEPSGVMQTGLTAIGGETYLFDSDGIMETGLCAYEGSTYCFGDDGIMQTGFVRSADGMRYFGENGTMRCGRLTIGSDTYYADENGILAAGWIRLDDTTYYADDRCRLVTGWQEIEGRAYYFDRENVLAVSTVIDGFRIGADGIARTAMAETVDNLLESITHTPYSIYRFCTSLYRYSRIEPTRTPAALAAAGWDTLVQYTLQNRRGVCYYLAATFDFYMQRLGYTTRIIHATHSTGDHYWVQVMVNGAWQNYDPTYSNRGNIEWEQQLSLGNYTVLGVVTVQYDARGSYLGSDYGKFNG